MRLHIEIDTDGAAFEAGTGEIYRVLRKLAMQEWEPDGGPYDIRLMDSNGNTCGRAWTTED